jgi:hypothetical protein
MTFFLFIQRMETFAVQIKVSTLVYLISYFEQGPVVCMQILHVFP